jgi:Zn-dependent peptidase ImmA (M78 family)/transcriptional regulator with XRE-family HTH domain
MKTVRFVPQVLKWARERAGLEIAYLAHRMKVPADQILTWEQNGELSFVKAKKLASYTRTPFGYLFLAEPLTDALPIPDFRTMKDSFSPKPSPDLLETIHTMQLRQEWMRDFLIDEGAAKLEFMASAKTNEDPVTVAARMRSLLGIDESWAKRWPTWEDALRHLREKIEQSGVLIFINGVVGNNTHRKLDPQEFRGFALCDDYAPLIFINGTDPKSAQMFTIAHEFAHLWYGKNGVSNVGTGDFPSIDDEKVCNAVAAEFLVPSEQIKALWSRIGSSMDAYQQIARQFKVSPIVAARRCLDLQLIDRKSFFEFYDHYINQEQNGDKKKKGGGDFWKTQNVRIGFRFGSAVVIAAKEGRLSFRDAYRLTGLSGSKFSQYSNSIGIPV